MQQAVNAADVNKHTEINDPADRAHDLHAGSEAVPNCFLCGFCFGKENCLCGADDAPALCVNLKHFNLHGFADKFFKVGNVFGGNLRSGNECACTVGEGNDDAALDRFFAGTFKNLSFGFGAGGEFFPRLLALDVFTGEQYIAFAVIYFENFNFDGIAHFVLGCGVQIGIVGELGARNISVGLVSDADADFAVNNLNDGARQNLTAVNSDDGLVDRLFVKYGIFLDVCCVCSCVFGCGFAIYISLILFAHCVDNLPDNRIRCRCTGNYAYHYIIIFKYIKRNFAFFCGIEGISAIFFTNFSEFLGIGAVFVT